MPEPTPLPSPWWRADKHADRRPFLLGRNRVQGALRRHFEERGFVEADPAILQVSPGNETHLHAFRTERVGPDPDERQRLYLHTSPEFALKKLLAAGERRPFAFAHVFRNRERGPLHACEFTMLEWYQAEAPYTALMADCAEIVALAAETTGTRRFALNGRTCDPEAPFERLAVAEAFAREAGVDLLRTIDADGGTDRDGLEAQVRAAGVRTAPDDTWGDLFSRVLVERVEPKLGVDRLTILDAYPIPEAALARPGADPRTAERFEAYACGLELANGFGELTDPDEQRRRFEADMDLKERLYGERYPIDEDFLKALSHMPESSGVALGFDRLVLLATGATRIDQVVWTPIA